MVRFVGGRGTIHRNRLDDVGIDGTLSEPLHFHTRRQLRLYGVGCIVKFVDECSANEFTLLLGLTYACQLPVKPFFSVNPFDIEADRKSAVSGKSVSIRVDVGGWRIINKKYK